MALNALRKKKRFEQQLNQIDGTLTTLEYQRESLENANTNTEVLKTMGLAAKAFKSAHLELDIDKVQDLKDDIAEQQELANEIADVISKPVGIDAQVDDDELMLELEALEQENVAEKMLEIPSAVSLPKVPTGEPERGSYICLHFNFRLHFRALLIQLITNTNKFANTTLIEPTKSKKTAAKNEEDELKDLMNWAS